MSEQVPPETSEIHYHLELTPAQLKITHTALRSLLDDFGHEEADVVHLIHEVLDKLPDEHAIRAIALPSRGAVGPSATIGPSGDDGSTPPAA